MKDSPLNLNRNQHRRGRVTLPLLLFSVFYSLFSMRAEARIYIQVDQASQKKFPVAIADLEPMKGGRSREWGRDLTEIIREDLELTGLFDLIPSDQHPTTPEATTSHPGGIQFAPWTLIGAQALVAGSYFRVRGGMQVVLHLYDPFLGQQLTGRNYVTNEKEMSIVAHDFADQIMKELTGEGGVFSTRIAFTQSLKKGKEIAVMDMNGDNDHTITHHKSISLSPAWSPSGDQIAYTTFMKGGTPEIQVIPSYGGIARKITNNGTINVSPTWSPRGILTVASALDGDTEIYLMNLRGGIEQKLTDSFGIDVNPSWSPDGSSFVFASERAGRLHLFKSDDNGIRRLTFVGTQNDNPAWSPKGDKIAFQSLDGNWDIFIMNTDGSQIQRLTSASGNNESPTWSPDGRFIAFSSNRSGKNQIFLMREDGSNQIQIGPGGATQPAWGPWTK